MCIELHWLFTDEIFIASISFYCVLSFHIHYSRQQFSIRCNTRPSQRIGCQWHCLDWTYEAAKLWTFHVVVSRVTLEKNIDFPFFFLFFVNISHADFNFVYILFEIIYFVVETHKLFVFNDKTQTHLHAHSHDAAHSYKNTNFNMSHFGNFIRFQFSFYVFFF